MFKKFRQLLSIVLVLTLVFNMLPVQCFSLGEENLVDSMTESDIIEADDASASADTEEILSAQVVGEDVSRRDEFYKEFVMDNGLRLASVYPEAVHFEKDGAWEDIDNTLVAATQDGVAGYSNTAGVWSVHFPAQLSGANVISVTKDGYTVSFGMAGALRSDGGLVVASIENELGTQAIGGSSMLTAATAQLSTAQIQAVDTSAMKAGMDHPEIVQDKLYSRLSYPTVYSGTNVTYDLSGNRLKESVILSAYDDGLWGYRYSLDTGGLVAVLDEDQSIDLVDADGEVVLHMPAPFLVDAAGEYCYNIDVALTQSGDGYTLAYYLPRTWLADGDRAWPVVLDPVVEANTERTNIRDVTVFQQNGSLAYGSTQANQAGVLYVGREPEFGKVRTFLKYRNLPELTSSDMIIYASINIASVDPYTDQRVIEARAVNGTWESESLTWSASESLVSSTVADYVSVSTVKYHAWDITDIARGWYEGENTGVVLKALDSVENNTSSEKLTKFYSSDYSEYSNKPHLLIVFRNNNGLESYWDYTASSAGRAGTGYVNDYTGNLVWVHSDMGFGGNRMPVSISHIYNANDSQKNTFGLGYGWRTSYNQLAYHWDGSTDQRDYYVWEDGDGTFHYFLYDAESSSYKDEDGLELTLKTTDLGVTGATIGIFDKSGNASYFDSEGRLFKLADHQATKSYVTITYLSSDSKKISTITDGAGRVYSFVYSGGLLSTLRFKGTGSTTLSMVSFFYEGSQLTKIQDPDGKGGTYGYIDGTNLLTTATDIDGYDLTYTYNTTSTTVPDRVVSIIEKDGTVSGGSLTLSYGKNQTTFKDQNGNIQVKQFNNWGNTLSVRDDQGRAQYAGFSNNDPRVESGKGNQLTLSSKLQATVVNKILNSSFESTVDWSASSSNVTVANVSGNSYIGNRSMKVITTSAATAGQGASKSYSVVSGKTYTFSAWVKTSSASAYLAVSDGTTTNTSEVLAKYQNTAWTRMEVSITAASTSLTVKVLTTDAGQFYIDCAQLELSPTASRYNLVQGGDFDNCGSSWGTISTSATSPVAPQLGATNCKLIGSPTATKRVSQTIPISGSKDDVFVVAGWAQGYSVPLTDGTNREFSIIVEFQGSSTSTPRKVQFSPNLHQWQYAAGAVIADQDYTSIKISLAYDYNANTAYFNGIQLYKEEFGHSYVYDDDGNVISVTDLQKQKTTYEYTDNDLTKATLPNGAELTYEYDDNHNVTKATSQTGMVYEFTYDAWGNNTSVSIVNGDEKITSTANYTTNGNYLLNSKDAAGYLTRYGYNEQTGVLNWVQYPEETTETRTEYTYDNMYRMASAAATTDTGLGMSASYTYTDDLLTKIQTPSTTYNFTYGDFALRSTVKVGNTTLATYTYTTDGNNRLDKLTYGNGDYVEYGYDDLGRLEQELFEDGATVKYQYDNSGALATVTDSESGITSTYYYDLIDRLCKYKEAGTDYSMILEYGFNEMNQVSYVFETINGNRRSIGITYDEDNRVSSYRKGSVTEAYTYDAYSRVTNKVTTVKTSTSDAETRLTETLRYRTNSSGNETGQVNTLSINSNGDYSTYFTYGYDMNGNIVSVTSSSKTTRYTYDSANQLIREDNQAEGKSWTWTYDAAGNILSKSEYAYTTGTLGTATDTVSYVYDTGAWGDLLKSFDGQAITYDGIGNPTSIGSRTFTWKHGRELATLTEGGVTWTNTYNADGLRIKRTNGTLTYQYYYAGGQLVRIAIGSKYIDFSYDASGMPMSLYYSGYGVTAANYYYVTNLQGDVVAILDDAGTAVVTYTYDAWGNILTVGGSMADTLGVYNPLRYRGYVYDQETSLYYLNSRYYDSQMGRFLNADVDVATGQGLTGNNMFAYCGNNPVNRTDVSGEAWWHWAAAVAIVAVAAVAVVATAGGAAGAAVAISCVANGVAVSSTATTVAAGVFVGSATALAASAYNAALESDSAEEFAEYGESALIETATGGFTGGVDAYNLPGHNCFAAGTLILCEDGSIPIEDICEGDLVWAWDEESGQKELKEVVELYVSETKEIVRLFVNGEEIITTMSHPFYSPVRGWTEAVRLRAGDILVLVNGQYVVVEKVQHEILESPILVFNFQVADYHTYYVSNTGVLVHNKCDVIGSGHGNQEHSDRIDQKMKELEKSGEYQTVYGNRSLNTAGLNGKQRPDVIAIDVNGNAHAWEYASPSQATGTRGYNALKEKIKVMQRNNPDAKFYPIIPW